MTQMNHCRRADDTVACFRCCCDAFACLSIIIGSVHNDHEPSTTGALIVAGLHVADRSSRPARSWREEAAAGGLQPCGRHGNSSRPQPAPSRNWRQAVRLHGSSSSATAPRRTMLWKALRCFSRPVPHFGASVEHGSRWATSCFAGSAMALVDTVIEARIPSNDRGTNHGARAR